jgi:hypothetical protein
MLSMWSKKNRRSCDSEINQLGVVANTQAGDKWFGEFIIGCNKQYICEWILIAVRITLFEMKKLHQWTHCVRLVASEPQ